MATSIKRVIVMFILMDTLIALMVGFATWNSTSSPAIREVQSSTGSLQNWSQDFESNFGQSNPDSSAIQFEKQFGDVRFGQKKIFEILINGVTDPFGSNSCTIDDCGNIVQTWITNGIIWFLIFIHIFGILDIVYIIYSKKYD